MTVDPRGRFTGLADLYRRHRPSYPPALFDWLVALFEPARPERVADVGCGTGISTRLLAARGLDVVGVDPNEDMLAAARAEGGARYVVGTGEATGLADASVDLVASAQSFDWFDEDRALAEFGRILRPGGWCAAWWNDRASSPFNDGYERLLQTWSEEYAAQVQPAPESMFRDTPGIRDLRRATFANAQRLDRDGWVGRVASSSYVRHGASRPAELLREVDGLFTRFQSGGEVEILYDCHAFAWRPAAPG